MKIISSTSITSTKGVTLISDIGMLRRRPLLRTRLTTEAAMDHSSSIWRDRRVENSSENASHPPVMRSASPDSLL